MKRNHYVFVAVVAALSIMFWSGFANYQHRKHQQELAEAQKRKSMYSMLVPDSPDAADQSSAPGDPMGPQQASLKGKPAPNFTLEDLSGKKVSLADYKGKAVLVNFWATWCGPCKIEIPWFIKLHDQYAAQGFEILGVSSDDLDKDDQKRLAEEKSDIAKFVKNEGMNYPVLIDGDTLSHSYGGVDSLPTSFYVDRNGTVVAQTVGLAPRDVMEANIKMALAGDAQ